MKVYNSPFRIFLLKNWWLFGKSMIGLTIFPFVFLEKDYFNTVSNEVLNVTLNHESIHIRQQIQLLVMPFFIWYGIEFFIRLIITRSSYTAYRNISFEKEAYSNENNPNYLSTKRFWSFLKYL